MGVKMLQCFPWYGRRKERSKLAKRKSSEVPVAVQLPEESSIEKTKIRSTPSVSSESDGQQNRAYFSGKARVSFRHELDSTISANDSTF